MVLFLVLTGFNAIAQNSINSKEVETYTSYTIDLDISTCTKNLNKKEIIDKESNTSYNLDLKNNKLTVTDKGVSVIVDFTILDTRMIFSDKNESTEAYITMVNNLPVLKFKNRDEDCFFYVLSFSK